MACRLALMSWERGHHTTVVTDSDTAAGKMDELMWESPGDRFLAHEVNDPNCCSSAPVVITPIDRLKDESSNATDVVINLCDQPIPRPGQFTRLLEIVPQEKEAREACREKYRYYRSQGISPATHEISK